MTVCSAPVASANHTQPSHHSTKMLSLPVLLSQPAPRSSSGCTKAQCCSSQLLFSVLCCLAEQTTFSYLGHIFCCRTYLSELSYWQNCEDGFSAAVLSLLGVVPGDRYLTENCYFCFPKADTVLTVSFGQTTLANPIHIWLPQCFVDLSENSALEVVFVVPVWAWIQHNPSTTILCDSQENTWPDKNPGGFKSYSCDLSLHLFIM